MKRVMRWGSVWLAALSLLAGLGGCSTWSDMVTATKPDYQNPGQPVYLDFPDVKLPGNMRVDREKSFVYQTDDIKAGMLNLAGHVQMVDLLSFFERQMPSDGWTLLSTFKYQKNVMIFAKQEKICMVLAKPPFGWNQLSAEIWVAPVKENPATVVMPIVDRTAGAYGDAIEKSRPYRAVPNQAEPLPAPAGPLETLPNQAEPLPNEQPLTY